MALWFASQDASSAARPRHSNASTGLVGPEPLTRWRDSLTKRCLKLAQMNCEELCPVRHPSQIEEREREIYNIHIYIHIHTYIHTYICTYIHTYTRCLPLTETFSPKQFQLICLLFILQDSFDLPEEKTETLLRERPCFCNFDGTLENCQFQGVLQRFFHECFLLTLCLRQEKPLFHGGLGQKKEKQRKTKRKEYKGWHDDEVEKDIQKTHLPFLFCFGRRLRPFAGNLQCFYEVSFWH